MYLVWLGIRGWAPPAKVIADSRHQFCRDTVIRKAQSTKQILTFYVVVWCIVDVISMFSSFSIKSRAFYFNQSRYSDSWWFTSNTCSLARYFTCSCSRLALPTVPRDLSSCQRLYFFFCNLGMNFSGVYEQPWRDTTFPGIACSAKTTFTSKVYDHYKNNSFWKYLLDSPSISIYCTRFVIHPQTDVKV